VTSEDARQGVYYAEATARQQVPDPLNLCIYATVALVTWLLGPIALAGFAVLGFAGYWRARRRGLRRSRCWLRDTRLVLGYLAALAAVGVWALVW
jgi:4-amino-4-deoxy-L-arabinose transferase-like glycosyltransferase